MDYYITNYKYVYDPYVSRKRLKRYFKMIYNKYGWLDNNNLVFNIYIILNGKFEIIYDSTKNAKESILMLCNLYIERGMNLTKYKMFKYKSMKIGDVDKCKIIIGIQTYDCNKVHIKKYNMDILIEYLQHNILS